MEESKKIHATEIPHYEGNMEKLVEFLVGELRYDKLVKFHELLAKRYLLEAINEFARDRSNLSVALVKVSKSETDTATHMEEVWKICEPFTK